MTKVYLIIKVIVAAEFISLKKYTQSKSNARMQLV